jgi:hypothetical protein
MGALNIGYVAVKLHRRILGSGAETVGAFNTGLDAVNMHRPTSSSVQLSFIGLQSPTAPRMTAAPTSISRLFA